MHLNIKSDEAHRLAVELAELTGESMATAVTHALREQLERERHRRSPGHSRDGVADALMDLGRRYAALVDKDARPADEILGYDENGLPS